MIHSVESLEAECERVANRPDADSAPPVLIEFTLDVPGDPAQYVKRLRSVLSVAVALGATADFEEESLPVDDFPDWFVAVSSADEAATPDFAKRGRDAFMVHTRSGPWELQNWLYRFDPDDDSRGWEWWDITVVGPGRVRVWVDSWGESFFGCQELRWAAYTAGALDVDGPAVQEADMWVAEAAGGCSGVS